MKKTVVEHTTICVVLVSWHNNKYGWPAGFELTGRLQAEGVSDATQ